MFRPTWVSTPAWDADARTIDSLSGDGYFSFKVGSSVGVACGLNSSERSSSYQDIQYGFLINNSNCRVIESGVVKYVYSTDVSDTDRFRIERRNGIIRYYVNSELIYTSTIPFIGSLFGDCSLYAYLDAVVDVWFVDYEADYNYGQIVFPFNASGMEGDGNYGIITLGQLWARGFDPYEDGYNSGAVSIGPINVFGSEEEINIGRIRLGFISASGSEKDINRGAITLGFLAAQGTSGDSTLGRASIGPITAIGYDVTFLPDYNGGFLSLGPVEGYGYQGWLDRNYAEIVLGTARSLGAEDGNFGAVTLGTATAIGSSWFVRYLAMEWPEFSFYLHQKSMTFGQIGPLTFPTLKLKATGNSDSGASSRVYFPSEWTLSAQGGGTAQNDLSLFSMAATATAPGYATAALTLPTWTLASAGRVGLLTSADWVLSPFTLNAQSGAQAEFELPKFTVVSQGTTKLLGSATLTLPSLTVTGNIIVGSIGRGTLEWSTWTITSAGTTGGISNSALILPTWILTTAATVSLLTSSLETTYVVNITTGAVTQFILGDLTKLVTAHGRLYLLKDGALIYLGGEDDRGTDIDMTLRFAPQQFNTYLAKRLSDIYLNSREVDGVTLSVVQDETTTWSYQTEPGNRAEIASHKVKVGRGVTFHSLGVILQNRNGGRLDVGGIEFLVQPLSRRLK